MTRTVAFRELGVFFLIFLPLTGLVQVLLFTIGGGGLIAVMMWSVGVAAMLAMRTLRRPVAELGWRWGPARYPLIALLLPVLYGGIAYPLAAGLGLVDFATPENLAGYAMLAGHEDLPLWPAVALGVGAALLGGLPGAIALGLGEEIGWRGFVAPRMALAFGFVAGTLATGLIWAAWHLPLILWGGYSGEGERWAELTSFLVMVVGLSGIMAWLRMASGSLWPAALLHGAHNLIIQDIFDRLVTPGPSRISAVSEFGFVLALVVLVVSLPFWLLGYRLWTRRQADLRPNRSATGSTLTSPPQNRGGTATPP